MDVGSAENTGAIFFGCNRLEFGEIWRWAGLKIQPKADIFTYRIHMSLTKLIIGTMVVIAGNAFLRLMLNPQQEGLSVGSDAGLFFLLPIEAIAYSIFVLLIEGLFVMRC